MEKEFFKDNKVYLFEMNKFYCGIPERENLLISQGYIPVFDRRTLHFINGKGGSLILENDVFAPDGILNIQKEISAYGFKNDIHKQYCSLHPNHLPEIKSYIEKKQVKNILIDSLFKDTEQFRFMIIKLFADFVDINFFINSRGTLIDTLNKELSENMDKYPVRNPYYKFGKTGAPYFNELTFVLMKNNIYEIDGDIMRKIKLKVGDEKCESYYSGSYKFLTEKYPVIDGDVTPETEKSKWSLDK